MLSVCPGVEGDPTGGSEGRGRASGSGGRPPAATAACRPRRARLSSPKVTHAAHADGLCALVALSHPSHSGGALDPLCPHRGLRPAFLRLLPLQRANAAIGRSERPPRSRGRGRPSGEGAFRGSRDCIERGLLVGHTPGAWDGSRWDTKQWQNSDATGRLGNHPKAGSAHPSPKRTKLNTHYPKPKLSGLPLHHPKEKLKSRQKNESFRACTSGQSGLVWSQSQLCTRPGPGPDVPPLGACFLSGRMR